VNRPAHDLRSIDRAVSLAVAVTLVIGWLVDASPMATGTTGWPLRTALIVAVGVLWLAAIRWPGFPLAALGIGTAIAVAWLNVDRLIDQRAGGASLVLLVIVLFWIALRGTLSDTAVALAASLLASLSYLANAELVTLAGLAIVLVLETVTARSYSGQRAALADLRAAQAELEARATAEERRRIAKEVHDVAAHSLAISMLHLTGVRMLAQRRGLPSDVVDALAAAERAGRESMSELRQAVGLLAGPSDTGVEAPLPTGADVAALVEACRSAGLPVGWTQTGDPATLPPIVGLAAYRIVQEALANVVKHASGASVQVTVAVGDSTTIRIVDSGGRPGSGLAEGSGSGFGLQSMRERTASLGGTLEAGRRGASWSVVATIPTPAAHEADGAVHA